MRIRLVFDASTWIFALHGHDPSHALLKRCFHLPRDVQLIVNSYCVMEILNALKNTTHDPSVEKHFWAILNSPSCLLDFDFPLSKDLLRQIRRKAEMLMIARMLELEPKDVPYLVLSYTHDAVLVTEDFRSIISKKNRIFDLLKVRIVTSREALLLIERNAAK